MPDLKPTVRLIHLDDSAIDLDRVKMSLNQNSEWCQFQLESYQCIPEFETRLRYQNEPDAVLLDLHLHGQAEGIGISQATKAAFPNCIILFFSSSRDGQAIVAALNAGADDFISKRSDKSELAFRIFKAIELAKLKRGPPLSSSASVSLHRNKPKAVGRTIQGISNRIPLLLSSAVTSVYIEGESGTGKEEVANLISYGLKPETPFVKINCAALSQTLLESELFGHSRGAFTGATFDKKGLFEIASEGWIFLDEVGSLSLPAQAAILRAIENHEIRRVGESQIRRVNFKVASANNESIETLVISGKFRKDLWQRLTEEQIELPPLRARLDEIPELTEHFCNTMKGGPFSITDPALEILMQYDYRHGNVRELRNCLKTMTQFQIDRVLGPLSVPERIWKAVKNQPLNNSSLSSDNALDKNLAHSNQTCLEPSYNFDFHCLNLLKTLIEKTNQEKGKTSIRQLSARIGVSRKRLSNLMGELVKNNIYKPADLEKRVGFKF